MTEIRLNATGPLELERAAESLRRGARALTTPIQTAPTARPGHLARFVAWLKLTDGVTARPTRNDGTLASQGLEIRWTHGRVF